MEQAEPVEKRLLCRKCLRSGRAVWQDVSGRRVLLSLSEGFHRRARLPLDRPPDIVCDCGVAQGEH
jgi:hypothetical protein